MSAYATFLFLPASAPPPISTPTTQQQHESSVEHGNRSDTNQSDETTTTRTEKDNSTYWHSKRDILISIQSATIDPMRLIQFIGGRRRNDMNPSSNNDQNCDLSVNNNPLSERCDHKGADNESSSSPDCEESWSEYDEKPQHTTQHHHRHRSGGRFDASSSRDDAVDNDADDNDDETHRSTPNADENTHSLNRFHHTDNPSITSPTLIQPPQNHHRTSKNSKSSKSKTRNQDDDALQFNIGVTLNGRKYTVTRALPSFVQLRNDVVAEMNRCQPHTSDDYAQLNPVPSSSDGPEQCTIPNLPIGHSRTHTTSSHSHQSHEDEGNIFDHLERRARAVAGFAGRGFSRLQAALCSYCPEMEEWLRAVAFIVPKSPSLANFLWESDDEGGGVGGIGGEKELVESFSLLMNGGSGGGGGGGVQQLPTSTGTGGLAKGRNLYGKSYNSMSTLNAITESDSGESEEWGVSEDEDEDEDD